MPNSSYDDREQRRECEHTIGAHLARLGENLDRQFGIVLIMPGQNVEILASTIPAPPQARSFSTTAWVTMMCGYRSPASPARSSRRCKPAKATAARLSSSSPTAVRVWLYGGVLQQLATIWTGTANGRRERHRRSRYR